MLRRMKKIVFAALLLAAFLSVSCNKDGFDGNAGMVVTTMVRLN